MKTGPIAKGSRLPLKTDGFIPFGLIPTHGESALSIIKKALGISRAKRRALTKR